MLIKLDPPSSFSSSCPFLFLLPLLLLPLLPFLLLLLLTSSVMPTWEIRLLETDYTNMAVLYTCKDILDMAYIEMAWVMSRERTLPSRMVGEALELLEGQGIDVSLMTRADQTDCDPLVAEETTPS